MTNDKYRELSVVLVHAAGGKNIRSIDKKTLELFQSYQRPGNIRELQNVIERSVIVSSGDIFLVDKSWLSRNRLNRHLRLERCRLSKVNSVGDEK